MRNFIEWANQERADEANEELSKIFKSAKPVKIKEPEDVKEPVVLKSAGRADGKSYIIDPKKKN